jgi:hypothetical protein
LSIENIAYFFALDERHGVKFRDIFIFRSLGAQSVLVSDIFHGWTDSRLAFGERVMESVSDLSDRLFAKVRIILINIEK